MHLLQPSHGLFKLLLVPNIIASVCIRLGCRLPVRSRRSTRYRFLRVSWLAHCRFNGVMAAGRYSATFPIRVRGDEGEASSHKAGCGVIISAHLELNPMRQFDNPSIKNIKLSFQSTRYFKGFSKYLRIPDKQTHYHTERSHKKLRSQAFSSSSTTSSQAPISQQLLSAFYIP